MVEGKILSEQQTAVLRERIEKELILNQKKFILDLKSLQFVNSVCLNFLISAKIKIAEKGAQVVLCNVSDQLRKLLVMTKLEHYFQIASRTADALNLLNQLAL
ncbi:MAG: STAS domain-containing protein [Chitinophagales bacterium]|nr:STAS domain-containing protein [Chitinophagales bacterium]